MSIRVSSRCLLACALSTGCLTAAEARQPADLVGVWAIASTKAGTSCRVQLRPQRSDKGDYFLGMPSACRHAMPTLAAVGRWAMPDDDHIALDDPAGTTLVTLAASGEGFTVAQGADTLSLTPVATGPAATGLAVGDADRLVDTVTGKPGSVATMGAPGAAGPAMPAPLDPSLVTIASTPKAGVPPVTVSDLAGRYAVMREKRDTGCMVTLDAARSKGGERAQLAPGCRDQGIVIFDPSAWQIIRGELVLTARAGHKTTLDQQEDGSWQKAQSAGGKPLGLKKL